MPSVKVKLKLSGPNEVFASDSQRRELYRPVLDELEEMSVEGSEERTGRAHEKLLAKQREYTIREGYKTYPIDWFLRLISASDWERLERGLAQRLRAVDYFLRRLEAGKEEVVPIEVIESSGLYNESSPDRFGEVPTRQMSFDLVAVEAGSSGESGEESQASNQSPRPMPGELAPLRSVARP